MAGSPEIAVLNDLVRATCHSTDRYAMASRACPDGFRRLVIEQLCEDRRLLLVDLIRCLLLRGVPVPEVRRSVTDQALCALPVVDTEVVWIDVEIAERKLHRMLREALEDVSLSEPVRELLSFHYLRIGLHHDEFEDLGHRRHLADGAEPELPAGHA